MPLIRETNFLEQDLSLPVREDFHEDFIFNTKIIRATSDRDFFYRQDVFSKSKDLSNTIQDYKSYPTSKPVALPTSNLTLKMSLEDAILKRVSTRNFSNGIIELEKISVLLRAATGLKKQQEWQTCIGNELSERSFSRAIPSAGARYPLELYLLNLGGISSLATGFFHLNLEGFYLEQMGIDPKRTLLNQAIPDLEASTHAKALFLVSGIFNRTTVKYGRRGLRFVLNEVGQLQAQMALAATALNIGLYHYGGGFDREIESIIGIDGLNEALLGISIIG